MPALYRSRRAAFFFLRRLSVEAGVDGSSGTAVSVDRFFRIPMEGGLEVGGDGSGLATVIVVVRRLCGVGGADTGEREKKALVILPTAPNVTEYEENSVRDGCLGRRCVGHLMRTYYCISRLAIVGAEHFEDYPYAEVNYQTAGYWFKKNSNFY